MVWICKNTGMDIFKQHHLNIFQYTEHPRIYQVSVTYGGQYVNGEALRVYQFCVSSV